MIDNRLSIIENRRSLIKTLFLTLRTFSATGGIEKVCRVLGKALYEESIQQDSIMLVCSMYDKQQDAFNNIYFPSENFRGYGINKLSFIREMVTSGFSFDRVILSHINLLPVGWMIKQLAPKTKLILLAHGIEIWYPLSAQKRMMLKSCDNIIAVSNYTKQQVNKVHQFPLDKISVLNNPLDPFLPQPSAKTKDASLLQKYKISPGDAVLMSLTRLASRERYKGYDKVVEAIATLKDEYPIKYIVAGRYDNVEKNYIDDLLKKLRCEHCVIMPGFIPDEKLEDHFALSDAYIMPSRKEGFGIVFIEAMYYGLPVIAGNTDGSADALLGGQLGQLVDPFSVVEIRNAIINILQNKTSYMPDRELLIKNFNYDTYKQKLAEAL